MFTRQIINNKKNSIGFFQDKQKQSYSKLQAFFSNHQRFSKANHLTSHRKLQQFKVM